MILSNCHSGFESVKLFVPRASVGYNIRRLSSIFGEYFLFRYGKRSNDDFCSSFFQTIKQSSRNFVDTKTAFIDFLANIHPLIKQNLVKENTSNSSMETNDLNQECFDVDPPTFNPTKIVILTKLTRLEFERRTNANLSETELANCLKRRGSDYNKLLEKFQIHTSYLKTICKEFEKRGIEYKVLQRWEYNQEIVDWADAIFTAGGDGTFLLAANKVRDRKKPVIGINTDPTSSEGYMCLMKKCSETQFSLALDKLLKGEFQWLLRQRIRITLSGNYAFDDPIELHDQQLFYPEHRWLEYVKENEDNLTRKKSRTSKDELGNQDLSQQASNSSGVKTEHLLPHLALNEVFIGESVSSRVSYYELQIDDKPKVKQRSSGLIICTGSGSTSWHFNVNKLPECGVPSLLNIIDEEFGVKLPVNNEELNKKICKRYNDQFIFCPSDLLMAYTVKDPICNVASPDSAPPRGFARKVFIKSRCFDAHLAIDGGLSYVFKDGAQAKLEMFKEDALRTVVFR